MTPKKLLPFIVKAIEHETRILIVGPPGVGKSDMVAEACKQSGARLILSHPSISDPTDYKGLPALVDKKAEFLPFGDLRELLEAKEKTVCLLDDIGQAAPAVQAALMQLVLARQINGKRISNKVTFMGATNDIGHQAGVSGMIEPLKTRFDAIVHVSADVNSWIQWATERNFPFELTGFIRFRGPLLSAWKPTREIKNSPTPRTWASVAKLMRMGLDDEMLFDAVTGAVGEGAAIEFRSFMSLMGKLPNLDDIIAAPASFPIQDEPGIRWAICSGLSRKADKSNMSAILIYMERLSKELTVACVKDFVTRDKNLCNVPAFTKWAASNASLMI